MKKALTGAKINAIIIKLNDTENDKNERLQRASAKRISNAAVLELADRHV